MTIDTGARKAAAWGLLLPAATIMMLTMGTRQTSGLFVSPINSATGMGVVAVSFALAIGQFVWGVSQPLFGALADKFGPIAVIIFGGVLLAVGTAATPWVTTEWGLIFTMGLLVAAGAGAGSFSLLIGATARHLPPERRSFGAGFINAGGSFGQFVFAPITERLIAFFGWINAMYTLAALTLLTIPLALKLRSREPVAVTDAGGAAAAATAAAAPPAGPTLREQLGIALRDRSYLLLHAGFFTCGFHIAFLVTHLPGEVALCGLPPSVAGVSIALIGLANIAGSLIAGAAGGRYRMKYILFWMYGSRAVLVLLYLAAPKEPITFYLFAIGLGATWLATVPPTAGLVGKLFGIRYLATLFGLTLLSHQIGGFLGAWLGGIAIANSGSYWWMWIADAALAAAAAVVNLPIREAKVLPAGAQPSAA
ncbi:MAG: MFS transporter [Lautropia sp.]